MSRSAHISPGFTPLQWLLIITLGFCLALTGCYAGMDGVVKESEFQDMAAWKSCLREKTLYPSSDYCRWVQARIVETANQTE